MSTLKADTIQSTSGGAATLTKQEGSKARVNGTPTATVNASFNISSGTDNGTGDFSYSLSNSMSNNLYTQSNTARAGTANEFVTQKNSSRTSSSVMAVFVFNDAGADSDVAHDAHIVGDLA